MFSLCDAFVHDVALQEGEERRIYRDPDLSCLVLDVSRLAKTWRVVRFEAGRRRLMKIGNAEEMPLAEARRIAGVFGSAGRMTASSAVEASPEKAERAARRGTGVGDPAESALPTSLRAFVETTYGPHARTIKRSYAEEMRIIRNHIFPALGEIPLAGITKADIRRLMQEKTAAGYGPSMVNRILATVKSIFARAADWETDGIKESPARGIRQLRCPNRIDAFLTPEEAQRLQASVSESENPLLRFIIAFLLLSGARKREALDARREHVDVERRILTVPLSKSGKPRYIPLSDEAVRVLAAARREVLRLMPETAADTPWIFPNPATGRPFVNIFVSWNNARTRAGLGHIRVHDLRHSFASALVNEGMTLYDVKEILGHANMATTTRYAHLSRPRLQRAATVASTHYKLSI
jgi:integrase